MRNRAKCKLCNCVIESFHATDYVVCKCGQISLDGGESLRCGAIKWENFMRVDDEGNEIHVKIQNDDNKSPLTDSPKPTKKELIAMLDDMVKSFEVLPQNAMVQPITHYDLLSVLLLFSSIFKSED